YHFIDAGESDNRVDRHRKCRAVAIRHNLRTRKGTRPKLAVVMHFCLNYQYAILRRYAGAYARDLAVVNGWIALQRYSHLLSSVNIARFALGYFRAQSQWVHSHNADNRGACGKILTDARSFLLHDSIERRINGRVLQLLSRDLEFRTALNDERLAVANLLDRILIPAERDFVLSFRALH